MKLRRAIPLVVLLAACASDGDAPLPVAWVGTDTLDLENVARLLVLAQPFPRDTGAVEDLVRHWQHVTALRAHEDWIALLPEATGPILRDSAIAALRASRMPDPVSESARLARTVYDAGEVRLIAHVLRRANAMTRVEEGEIQRRTAAAILHDLDSGGTWAAANVRNEDDGAREQGGIIGLVSRGELPPPLDSVAFTLAPGAISRVIVSNAGFHILRRPTYEEVRALFGELLAARIARMQENQLATEAANRRNATLAPTAALRIREVAQRTWGALGAADAVGTFDGGQITAGDVALALAERPWDARRALFTAPADVRESFAGRLLLRALLAAEAADAGITPSPADSAAAVADVRARVSAIEDRLGPMDARRYLEAIAARHIPLDPMPPLFAQALLQDQDSGFLVSAIEPALERTRALLLAAGYTGR